MFRRKKGGGWETVALCAFVFALGRMSKGSPSPAERLRADALSFLVECIEEWRPIQCDSEQDYELALHNYLLGRLSKDRIPVQRQFGLANSRLDIVVDKRFAIELKADLRDEAEVKRLLGQAVDMEEHFDGFVVVLCGQTAEETFIRLQDELHEVDEEGALQAAVVTVPALRRRCT